MTGGLLVGNSTYGVTVCLSKSNALAIYTFQLQQIIDLLLNKKLAKDQLELLLL